jgi:hypothetical protein
MYRTLIATAIAAAVVGCSGGSADLSATGLSTTPPRNSTTTTTTSPSRAVGALADEWDKKFDVAMKASAAQPCGQATVRTSTCASWLTDQVEIVSALDAALRARSDSRRYVKTLVSIEKVMQSSEAYAKAKCYAGGGTDEDCWNHAWQIGIGTLTVKTQLRADDLSR